MSPYCCALLPPRAVYVKHLRVRAVNFCNTYVCRRVYVDVVQADLAAERDLAVENIAQPPVRI